jgi:hypothetical protein
MERSRLMRQVAIFFGAGGAALMLMGGNSIAFSNAMIDDPSEYKRGFARGWRSGGRWLFFAGAAFLVVALVLLLFSLN